MRAARIFMFDLQELRLLNKVILHIRVGDEYCDS